VKALSKQGNTKESIFKILLKMSVNLRKRKNSDGSITLLLDIYHNGKRNYEFLKELKLCKPTSPIDRKENKERLELAERIRNKREQQLQSDEYDISPAFKKGIDFVRFFEEYESKYTKKDKRTMVASLNKFKSFMIEEGISSLTTKQINENIVTRFKDYLEDTLKGESPANYFSKFKKMLKYGVREKIFTSNPAQDITIKKNTIIKKQILTFEEIQMMAKVPVTNNNVKRAFLFSCLTGLRFCDIVQLKWKNIQSGIMNLTQQKTGIPVSINLNQSALAILGERGKGEEFVFNLPSHNACIKDLSVWCKKAGIEKKITWHCARHSFATGIIYYGSDVKNASSLLGHNSLSYTDRYLRIANSLKEKAVSNLPEVSL
jgi:integrase/recombinase XerD